MLCLKVKWFFQHEGWLQSDNPLLSTEIESLYNKRPKQWGVELTVNKRSCGKESTDNTINRKRKGKLLLKNEEISGWKSKTNTKKLEWYISVIIEKGICDCQNILLKFPCVYVWLSSRDLFFFQ